MKRNFELARFIRARADPETLSRDELIDELYDIANYASLKISENITLRGIIDRSINNNK